MNYTTFAYADLQLDTDTLTRDGKITASVKITNTGKRKGTEIVQLYSRDTFASLARPVKELKGFHRITLKPGESKVVTFEITPAMLGFYNNELEYVCEPGEFEIMVGPDSEKLSVKKFFYEDAFE